jgi:hypothetical protein
VGDGKRNPGDRTGDFRFGSDARSSKLKKDASTDLHVSPGIHFVSGSKGMRIPFAGPVAEPTADEISGKERTGTPCFSHASLRSE